MINPVLYYDRPLRNNYGTILSDLTGPFFIVTKRYQFENKNPCYQNTKDIVQTNIRHNHLPDPKLTDVESELWGITRYFSRLPSSKYQGYNDPQNDKNIVISSNMNTINSDCDNNHKIIRKYYYEGVPIKYPIDSIYSR